MSELKYKLLIKADNCSLTTPLGIKHGIAVENDIITMHIDDVENCLNLDRGSLRDACRMLRENSIDIKDNKPWTRI